MTFLDLTPDLKSRMPELRGRPLANRPLTGFTWFRAGGSGQVSVTSRSRVVTS